MARGSFLVEGRVRLGDDFHCIDEHQGVGGGSQVAIFGSRYHMIPPQQLSMPG